MVLKLGTKTKKHHVYLFYCMVGNIPPIKRSPYEAIFLLAVCKTKHLKEHRVSFTLKPFIHNLHILSSPDGCSVLLNGAKIKFSILW